MKERQSGYSTAANPGNRHSTAAARYSSTSGVVLPAFLPTVPGLAEQVGGVAPLAIASSMNVGAHLVDVSALSTLGALRMASAAKHEDSRRLFKSCWPGACR